MNRDETRKKLMFLTGEDFYFLTYNIVVALDVLDCLEGKRVLKDYRKLAFLIDFIANPFLVEILGRRTVSRELSLADRQLLLDAYANGMLRSSEIFKLLFSLERQGYVLLKRREGSRLVDICLTKKNVPLTFFDKSIFGNEYTNAKAVMKSVQRISSIGTETMLTKLFDDSGITRWQTL